MSGYQTLPVAGSVSCLQNPLLAKSRGLCASFSALCGFEVAARLNLSLIMTAEVRDDLDHPNIASACPSLVIIYFAVYMGILHSGLSKQHPIGTLPLRILRLGR